MNTTVPTAQRAQQLRELRSLLFLPANSPQLLPKATERGADALIVDLEDAVPLSQKAAARPLAAQAIASLATRGAVVLLRINSEPEQWQEDLAHQPLDQLTALMLPKVESLEQIDRLAAAVQHLGELAPALTIQIETPRGIIEAPRICAHSRLSAVGFGGEDYSAALGVAPSSAALAWPAQQLITSAHAFALPCWGLAASVAEIQDLDAYTRSVGEARSMGFTGAVCIHPRQVAIVNQGFAPSPIELEWAARVIAADLEAQAAGIGALVLDGKMIDRPIVERARGWLRQASANSESPYDGTPKQGMRLEGKP